MLLYLFAERKCSRFQFECRSTGECIAIYNACDGIPQCADGSDEAPELKCPETFIQTTTPSSPIVQSHSNLAFTSSVSYNHKILFFVHFNKLNI